MRNRRSTRTQIPKLNQINRVARMSSHSASHLTTKYNYPNDHDEHLIFTKRTHFEPTPSAPESWKLFSGIPRWSADLRSGVRLFPVCHPQSETHLLPNTARCRLLQQRVRQRKTSSYTGFQPTVWPNSIRHPAELRNRLGFCQNLQVANPPFQRRAGWSRRLRRACCPDAGARLYEPQHVVHRFSVRKAGGGTRNGGAWALNL